MIELDLFVNSAGHRLAGTLCLPNDHGPHPVALMVHGSGPLDRNENLPGQSLNAFNTIAHHLVQRGIASLRYDKRGCGESEGDFYRTGHHELVEDAHRWLQELDSHPECRSDALYVLGHSEGTVIAPQLSDLEPSVAGLVLLCPFVEHFESVLLRQARQIESELAGRNGPIGLLSNALFRLLGADVRTQARLIARLRQSTTDYIWARLRKVPARWYRELFALELPVVYSQVECPVLLLGGEKDLQCRPEDVAEIAELLSGPVTAELVPDLTHLLRFDTGEASLSRSRRLLAKPVEPLVIEAVSIWLEEQVNELGQPAAS